MSRTFGGIITNNATAPGKLPRDEKQVSNFKSKGKQIAVSSVSNDAAADILFIVMQQAYTEFQKRRHLLQEDFCVLPFLCIHATWSVSGTGGF